MRTLETFTWAFTVLVLAAAGTAGAQDVDDDRDNDIRVVRLDLHADLGFLGFFGVGGRVDIPIVPNGLTAGGNDELAISPGVELLIYHWHHGHVDGQHVDHAHLAVSPHTVLQWNFYLPRGWSVFPELGLAVTFGDYGHHGPGHDVFVDPVVGFGARYHMASRAALLMRASWPYGFQLGLTF